MKVPGFEIAAVPAVFVADWRVAVAMVPLAFVSRLPDIIRAWQGR